MSHLVREVVEHYLFDIGLFFEDLDIFRFDCFEMASGHLVDVISKNV